MDGLVGSRWGPRGSVGWPQGAPVVSVGTICVGSGRSVTSPGLVSEPQVGFPKTPGTFWETSKMIEETCVFPDVLSLGHPKRYVMELGICSIFGNWKTSERFAKNLRF